MIGWSRGTANTGTSPGPGVNDALAALEDWLNACVLGSIQSTPNIGLSDIKSGVNSTAADIAIPSVSIDLSQANISDPSLEQLSAPPALDLSDVSKPNLSLGRVDIPQISLPKLPETVEDFDS